MTNFITGRTLAIAGAMCQLGPVMGLAGTATGMREAFDAMGAAGIGDPTMVSQSIGHVLISTIAGLVVGILGLILLTLSLTRFRYRAPWFFWFLVIYGVLLVAAFPVGTAFGVFFLIFCLTKRHEFLRPVGPPTGSQSRPPSIG